MLVILGKVPSGKLQRAVSQSLREWIFNLFSIGKWWISSETHTLAKKLEQNKLWMTLVLGFLPLSVSSPTLWKSPCHLRLGCLRSWKCAGGYLQSWWEHSSSARKPTCTSCVSHYFTKYSPKCIATIKPVSTTSDWNLCAIKQSKQTKNHHHL